MEQDFLRSLMALKDEAPTLPMPEAQEMELQKAFAKLQEWSPEPGQLVKFKDCGLCPIKSESVDKLVFMFVRWLDGSAMDVMAVERGQLKQIHSTDCMVWHMSDDNSTVIPLYVDHRTLEPRV